jgi:oligoendopeptidase F
MTQLIPERKEIPAEHKWDLSPLFTDDSQWEALYAEIEKSIDGYRTFEGKLGSSLEVLRGAFEFDLGVSRKLERLYTYAHLKSDEDKSDQRYLGLQQRAMNLYTRSGELSSFMTPEIQSIPEDILKKYMAHESMRDYRFSLEKILRGKPHTLSQEIEQILAMSSEVAQAPSQVFSQLDNADLSFGIIEDESGARKELSHGNFSTFLINPSRELRKKAFFQYYDSYEKHKHTIAATLSFSNRKDAFYSRVRKFPSSREASLFSDNVPAEVYDNLIETVKRNTEPLFRYMNFRREVLGLDELHFYDTYVPIIPDVNFTMGYDEAVDTCVSALEPLGREYCDTLKAGLLADGWTATRTGASAAAPTHRAATTRRPTFS